MGKNKKKRNKKYTGVDAVNDKPIITRIEAVNRNKISQYWFDHKKVAKPMLIGSGVVAFLVILIFQIVQLFGR